LSVEERRVLVEVLDIHLQGMADAKEAMIEDTATLSDFDTFTKTLQEHDIDTQTVESIRRKVREDDNPKG